MGEDRPEISGHVSRTIDTEIDKSPEDFVLLSLERALVVEPLLEKAEEWFNEDHLEIITPEKLDDFPGVTKEIKERYETAHKMFESRIDANTLINERMNPLRGNTLTPIFVPVLLVFDDNADGSLRKYHEYAISRLGDGVKSVAKIANNLMDDIAYRKAVGYKTDDVQIAVDRELKQAVPNWQKIEELKSLMAEMRREAKIPIDEVRRVYVVGRLTRKIIHEMRGEPNKESLEELLAETLKPVERTEKIDFLRKMREIEKGLR